VNKPIKSLRRFQFSQGLDQHLLGNVRDGTLEFVETSRPRLRQTKQLAVQVSAMTRKTCPRWVLRVVKGFVINGFGASFHSSL